MIKKWREFSVAVRRQETPFYACLYKIAKKVTGASFPVVKPLHSFLYNEWALRTNLWHEFWRIFYYEPIFKSQCLHVGSGFKMHYSGNGTTRIHGDLQIYIGSNVTIFDKTTFAGLKVLDKPELHIGNNTYIAPNVIFYVGKKISIGSHCMIGCNLVADNPGHPFDDVLARMQSGGGSPTPESIRPINIGDFCQLTLETVVYPGTTIGDGVVARYGTHLNKTIPPFCLVGGNPWKIIKKLPIPDELRSIVGDERFESYLEVHKTIDAGCNRSS
jgi:acetyltransferase-like isoleucine patch superfamily enzyme